LEKSDNFLKLSGLTASFFRLSPGLIGFDFAARRRERERKKKKRRYVHIDDNNPLLKKAGGGRMLAGGRGWGGARETHTRVQRKICS
jgi:hypothetical protein